MVKKRIAENRGGGRLAYRTLPRRWRDVRHADLDLLPSATRFYVRGYNGTKSRWYQAALRQKAGRIIAAGLTKEVSFEPVEGPINDSIDDAYRSKYGGSLYLKPMIGAGAATVKIMPIEVNHGD